MKNKSLLTINHLSLAFGKNLALNDVSLHVNPSEILALIGPNGAGKTSMLNCITSFYKPGEGEILFKGMNITNKRTHHISKLGISRTFQGIELFSSLSVLDNLMAGRHILMKTGVISASLFFGKARGEEIKHREAVEDIIDLLELQAIRNKLVGSLPYGQRKRVDLGRALVLEPKVLLLDEPLAGMNVEEKEDMVRFILDIHELRGTAIILVEHDMGVVMDIVDRVVVLDFGLKIAEGIPEEIKGNQEVIKAYLGKAAT
jgi:branched-chain amino acid transport system ATP-binding protein